METSLLFFQKLAAQLKLQLQKARDVRKLESTKVKEEKVILTRTDARGSSSYIYYIFISNLSVNQIFFLIFLLFKELQDLWSQEQNLLIQQKTEEERK